MTGAELRARLAAIGLTVNQLASINGWDQKYLQQQASGVLDVTARTITGVEAAERDAADITTQYEQHVQAGETIKIPANGPYPRTFYLAIAGTVWGEYEDAVIDYE